MSPYIAFLGAGNMARAMISGLIAEGFSPEQLRASDPSSEALENLRSLGLTQLSTVSDDIFKDVDLIVAAVKPQVIPAALASISNQLNSETALLSIAAGIPIASLQQSAGLDVPIIRCMPNTPAMIRLGASALFAQETVSQGQRALAERVTNAAGMTVWVEREELLDVVTAVSGSGPAYFFALIEAVAQAGTDLGLDKEVATALTLQTAMGAAALALRSEEGVAKLRENVTSPGGTTEQALRSLKANQFDAVVSDAVKQCAQRASTLGKEFG